MAIRKILAASATLIGLIAASGCNVTGGDQAAPSPGL